MHSFESLLKHNRYIYLDSSSKNNSINYMTFIDTLEICMKINDFFLNLFDQHIAKRLNAKCQWKWKNKQFFVIYFIHSIF